MTFFSKFLAKTLAFLQKAALFVDDLLFFGGVSVIVAANYQVNTLFGHYSLAVALIMAGTFVGRMLSKGKAQ